MAAWLALIKSKLLLPEEDEQFAKEITENLAQQIARLTSVRELGEQLANMDRLEVISLLLVTPVILNEKVKIKYEISLADLLRAHLKMETKREFSPLEMNLDFFVSVENNV